MLHIQVLVFSMKHNRRVEKYIVQCTYTSLMVVVDLTVLQLCRHLPSVACPPERKER